MTLAVQERQSSLESDIQDLDIAGFSLGNNDLANHLFSLWQDYQQYRREGGEAVFTAYLRHMSKESHASRNGQRRDAFQRIITSRSIKFHPQFLRFTRDEVLSTLSSHLDITKTCGQIDPHALIAFIGMGFRHFTLTRSRIPLLQHLVGSIDPEVAKQVVDYAIQASDANESFAVLDGYYKIVRQNMDMSEMNKRIQDYLERLAVQFDPALRVPSFDKPIGKLRVLFVDDGPDSAPLFRVKFKKIKGNSKNVDSVTDGQSAIEKWESDRPDVIVLDSEMPGLSGQQVVEEIRRREAEQGIPPEQQTIIISFTANGGRIPGSNGKLRKPFTDPRGFLDVLGY